MRLKYKPLVFGDLCVSSQAASQFYLNKLRFETDPADVRADLANGIANFVLLDVRSEAEYHEKHIAKAHSLPHSRITANRMKDYAAGTNFVVYCWGPGCNGSTKAALRLAQLGFAVKEMIGGIEYWEREGFPVVQAGD